MESVDFSSITDTCYEYDNDLLLPDDTDSLTGGALSASAVAAMAPPQTTLYGRNKETKALRKVYQRLLKTREGQAVILHGESGSGKTALVDTLRDPVLDTDGYFVVGKHFQRNAAVPEPPYSAIMAAFSDLCDLVVQSDGFDEREQREIANALGSEAQLLLDKSISNLASLVGDPIKNGLINNQRAPAPSFAKFKIACKSFLHAIASEKHPIVIFLDDIQWADEGSVQLIQMLLHDSGLTNVMLVLAYRDEESEQLFEAGGVLDRHLLRDNDPIDDIALSNLDASCIYEMVTSIMQSSTDEVRQLSDLVMRRTYGNPLHVIIFMETIQLEGLIEYEDGSRTEVPGSWVFNVDEIQQEIMVSNTLADLLARRIERLANSIKEALKVASLLGYNFNESVFLQVACIALFEDNQNLNPASIKTLLSEAVEEGFLETTSEGYQFTHDKLQSSFRSLIGNVEEDHLHLLIGEAFLAHGCERSNIYRAAIHLNSAPGFLHDHGQRVRLAYINLEAAKYCEEISAFNKAVAALRHGLDILGPVGRWSEEYFALTFEMMETLAKTQLIIGDFEACKQTTAKALRHGKTIEMNLPLLMIDVEVRMAGNEVDDAVATASRALTTLGVKMPRKVKVQHMLAKLLKVKFMLRHKTDNDILSLPFTEDIMTASAVRLLMFVCTYCLVRDETEMSVFSALLATELTLKNGLSHHSPCAFAIYGVAEVCLGNIDRAYRFGNLALSMLDSVDSSEAECPTVAYTLTMLASRKERLSDLVMPLYEVADSGFKHGDDIMYATYCASQCYAMQVHIGTNLASLEEAMRQTYGRVLDLGQDELLRWLQPTLQYILNMRADVATWENMAVLSGEIMDEKEYLNQAFEANHAIFVLTCSILKAKVATEFGQFALAESIFESCKSYGRDNIRYSWGAPIYYLDRALVYYGLFETSGQRRYLKQGRKYKRNMQRQHDAGCPNATPLLAFVVAYEESLKKNYTNEASLRASFTRGLDCLVAAGLVHLEGQLQERAGFSFARLGLRAEAEHFFERALHIYQHNWGATAKYNQLKQESTQALSGLKRIESSVYGRCISVPTKGLLKT